MFKRVWRGGLGETGLEARPYFPSATVMAAAQLIFCGPALPSKALSGSFLVEICTSSVDSSGSLRSTHPGRKMAFCAIDS